jgi:uncharacterized protein involved in response to NO
MPRVHAEAAVVTGTAAPSVSAHTLLFPAAAAYAAVAVPASVYALRTGNAMLPGIATPWGHARELLFGYALAVVAGFLLSRVRRGTLALLFGLWVGGRITALCWPEGLITLVLNSGFALGVVTLVAPRHLGAAKKLRNQAFAPTLIAIALMVAAFHVAVLSGAAWLRFASLQAALLMFTTLMLFMAGRIIAPAAAGHLRVKGRHLEARVQPRLEGGLLMLMAAALSALLAGAQGLIFSGLMAAAAVVAAVRLMRWRLWWCTDRGDLLCLGAGYAWLSIGLALWAAGSLHGAPPSTALHGITVGALGTLTITVMARTWLVKARQPPDSAGEVPLAVVCVSAAAALRLGAPDSDAALLAAAALWSAGFALLLVLFIRVHVAARRRLHHAP